MRQYWKLALICAAALGLRLIILPFVQHPGIADPNHYYNLALRLADGHGLTIDYIWHYVTTPESVVHFDDYWMPLAAIMAALPVMVVGPSVSAALLPFVIVGVLLGVLAFLAARQFGCSVNSSLFAAGAAVFLPELALYSIRSESVIPNSLFVGGCLLLLTHGLNNDRPWALIMSGIAGGLAYLTRSENMLLMGLFIVLIANDMRLGRIHRRWQVLLVPAGALLILVPWLMYAATTTSSPALSRLLFMTSFNDFYAYGRELSLETLLSTQSLPMIVGKRLFEFAASVKVMYTSLDVFLPVALFGGLGLLLADRDRTRLRQISPVLLYVLLLLLFYSLLAPYNSQGGSFKRAYVSLLPLLVPLAAYALDRAIPNLRLRNATAILAVVFLAANAFERMRADTTFVAAYEGRAERVAQAARTLPDLTGDGSLLFMAQDPFMLRFVGLHSIIFPEGDLTTFFDAADHYGVDYLLLPADRSALTPFYTRDATHPRLSHVLEVEGTEYVIVAVNSESVAHGAD